MRVHLRVIFLAAVLVGLCGQIGSGCCVELRWTAPGDDGRVGRASLYQIYYSRNPITESNWEQARVALWAPQPNNAGITEVAIVSGLEVGRTYYFAVRSRDDVGNWSALSNTVSAVVPEPVCEGPAGNVNCGANDDVTLSDLTTLVDYLFLTYRPLACPGEANIDGDPAGMINLSDVVHLLNFLFLGGPPPAPCQ